MASETKALLVPRKIVEAVRKKLLDAGYLDTKRKIIDKGNLFEIPITQESVPHLSHFTIVQQEKVKYYESAPVLRDLMRGELDDEKLDLLPGGWQIVGDIVITSLKNDLYNKTLSVGAALLRMHPHCKSVYLNNGITGKLRLPKRELMASRSATHDTGITIHVENGCKFKLDVTKVMFSKGNLKERIRMSRLGSGEVVVDMFAGIGYFTIPIAVHSRPKKILAIELNPESYHYLIENIRLNGVENIVKPILGDCAQKTPVSIADRVIMGYVGRTSQFLEYGIRALKPGGILHYHDSVPIHLMPSHLTDRIESEAKSQGRGVETLEWHKVKKYSPGVWHFVVDTRIR